MTPQETLFSAIERNDATAVLQALETGAEPHYPYWRETDAKPSHEDAYEYALQRGSDEAFAQLVASHPPSQLDCVRLAIRAMEHARGESLALIASLRNNGGRLNLNWYMEYPNRDGKLPIGHSIYVGEDVFPIYRKETLLLAAIRLDAKDDGARVAAVLSAGASPDRIYTIPMEITDSEIPIYRAVAMGHVPSIRALAAAGVDMEARLEHYSRRDFTYTPLAKACLRECSQQTHDVTEALLELGANPDVMLKYDQSLLTFLVLEKRHNALAQLLAHGADTNFPSADPHHPEASYNGWLPLTEAAAMGDQISAKLLLAYGADVNRCGERGRMPLHHAIIDGMPGPLFKMLMGGGADPYLTPEGGISPYDFMGHDGQRSLKMWKMAAADAVIVAAGKGHLTEKLVKDGKATETLLTYLGLGLLGEIGNAALWETAPEKGWANWQAMRASVPEYWQRKMGEFDCTSLRLAGEAAKGPHVKAQQQRMDLRGERRR